MQIGIGMWITSARNAGGGAAGPVTDPNITAFNVDGWSAVYTSPPTFDPVADPKYAYVTRSGYNASGGAATVTDAITVTTRRRQAHPNQASLSADIAALSDYVYTTDTVTGVTNNSTRAAPKPIAAWLNRDLERATSASHTVRMVVAHAHGRNGKPVAAVKFMATDGTTTVETLVSTMATLAYTASGYFVPCFEGVLDFSTLTQGAAITVDAVIYPYVGAAFTVSTDADAYPSPNLTTLRVLNDRTGAYGTSYAYVDGIGAGTPAVSTNPVTAAANPYATITAAAAAIKVYNNANLGRNNTDGSFIRVLAGTYTMASISASNTTTWPLTIEAADVANKLTTIWQDSGVSIFTSIPTKLVIRNLTIKRTSAASVVMLDNAAGAQVHSNMLSIENCHIDNGGFAPYGAWINRTGNGYFFECTGSDAGQVTAFSSSNKVWKSFGCNGKFAGGQTTFGIIGCRIVSALNPFAQSAASTGQVAMAGPFIGWNFIQLTVNVQAISSQVATGPRGAAIIGNVMENGAVATTSPLFTWGDDASGLANENLLVIGNTGAGSRTNFLYQDTGVVTIQKSGYFIGNLFPYFNSKSDVFGANANLIGNWSCIFKAGAFANLIQYGGTDGAGTGVGKWMGEIPALREVSGSPGVPAVTNWTLDKSAMGGSPGGGGDYKPTSGHAIPLLDAAHVHYPIDMRGAAISTSGTAIAGAVQP